MDATTNSLLLTHSNSQSNFYKKVDEHILSLNYKFREKTVIKEEMKNKILRCLSNRYSDEFDAKFKSWYRVSFPLQINIDEELLKILPLPRKLILDLLSDPFVSTLFRLSDDQKLFIFQNNVNCDLN